MKKQIIKVVVSTLFASSFALGVTPNIGDIEKQVKEPVIKKPLQSIPEIATDDYKVPMQKSTKLIYIKDFMIKGNEHIKIEKLEKFFSAFRNQELSFDQLTQIVENITKYYREEGYFVARAYIPAQNITQNENILEIIVIEGSYGDFKLNNNSLVKSLRVQGMLEDAKKRDNVIATKTLERSMLIINDTPGIVVTQADILPGEKVGTSDFVVTTEPSQRFDGYIVADNTGSRYTGKYRLMSGVNINSPFKIGDQISLFGLISNGSNLTNGKLSYNFPLASNGLRGEVAYSKTLYSLTDSYESLDAVGDLNSYSAKVTYPFLRSRDENLLLWVEGKNKELKDEVRSTSDVTKKNIKALSVGVKYDKTYSAYEKVSNTTIAFNITRGDLSFDDQADRIADLAAANTNGSFSKVNLDLMNTIFLNSNFSIEGSLKMQYALGGKNLDGSEDISIGGSSGVKIYPDGELSGENGYVFSIETKYKLPQVYNISSSLGVFYDRGKAWMADNTTNFNAKSLQDIGIGYYGAYKDYFGQIQLAWKLNSEDITSEPDANSRVLFQLGAVF